MPTPSRDNSSSSTPYADVGYTLSSSISYAHTRHADPFISTLILRSLGPSSTSVINIGAGCGSYEPQDGRRVVAVEPSAAMRSRRPEGAAKCVDASAEDLPFAEQEFEAAMAVMTVHQWTALERGVEEMKRVVRKPGGRIAILTCDGAELHKLWVKEYWPSWPVIEGARYPSITKLNELLGGKVEVVHVPIPRECKDGMVEGFYARPEELVKKEVRAAQSSWGLLDPEEVGKGESKLRDELASGEWDHKFGDWREREAYDGSLRLLVATT